MKYIKDILGEWAVRDFSTFAVFLHLEAEEQNNFLPLVSQNMQLYFRFGSILLNSIHFPN